MNAAASLLTHALRGAAAGLAVALGLLAWGAADVIYRKVRP